MKRAWPSASPPRGGIRDPVTAEHPGDAEVTDGEVIDRSRGEPERFALLFQRHADSIGRYAARRLGPELAQDIVAETFLLAFRQRATYDLSRRDARPWLYGIAGNLIRRHRRNEVRMLRALQRTGTDPVAECFADRVDDRLSADAASRAVAAAIASLHPGQRDVVLLVAWAELTYDQIAEALGIPEGTVRSRMNRARVRLRAALGGSHPDQPGRSGQVGRTQDGPRTDIDYGQEYSHG
jgi:RNA polymerase sigma factor (sigma-70 family)